MKITQKVDFFTYKAFQKRKQHYTQYTQLTALPIPITFSGRHYHFLRRNEKGKPSDIGLLCNGRR